MDDALLAPGRADPEAMIAAGRIDDDDVLALRRHVFSDGLAGREDCELVFRLDREVAAKAESWPAFYVDALADYLIWKAEPKKYVSEENARFLIDNILRGDRVDSRTGLELLLNVVHWALSCPEELAVLAVEAVKESVLRPDQAAYAKGRRAGRVDAADVEILRKVVYGAGSVGSYTVTRREAEVLLDLNAATSGADNAPAWRDLFVKAIGSHLLFPKGPPVTPSVEAVKRRDRWLEERRGIGGLLTDMAHEIGKVDPKGTWQRAGIFGGERARMAAEREDAAIAEAFHRERIDAEEAIWLADRLGRNGRFDDNEKALLAFIEKNARDVDPALLAVMDKAEI